MAGSQVEVAINQIEKQRLGYQAISLTNFDNDLEPQIAAGSKVEIGGALFEFTAPESITGWAGIGASNNVYIKLVVAGTAVTAEFTTAAPTWSTSKQGWYVGLDRYIGGLYKDAGGNYTAKYLYDPTARLHSIREEDIADSAIITAKIADNAVAVAKVPDYELTVKKITKDCTGGSEAIAGGNTWLVPEGLFQILRSSAEAGTLILQLYALGAWRSAGAAENSWMVRSDGVNMRLWNNSENMALIYYQRFW